MAIFERRENLPKSIDSGNIFVNFLLGGRILLVVLLTCAPGTSCSYSCVRMMRDTQAPEQASPVGARSSYASLTVLHAGGHQLGGALFPVFGEVLAVDTVFAEPVRLFLSLRGASATAHLNMLPHILILL